MTTEVRQRSPLPGGRRLSDGRAIYWWVEILAILAYYGIYSFVRNANGSHPPGAFPHAKQIISIEHYLGIFHEATLQQWALHFKPLIVAANYFYGSFHFIVTIYVGIFLFRKCSDEYPFFRNTLAIATALALIGFKFYPLMPPRLLPAHYGFVDTLEKYPTFWSFDSGGMKDLSNQFAAMPSVHICWSTFCALALGPRLKNPLAKTLAWLYPFFTLVVIVVTANHYIIDAAGGLIILAVGWIASGFVTRAGHKPPSPFRA
jgi:hypothetical protein